MSVGLIIKDLKVVRKEWTLEMYQQAAKTANAEGESLLAVDIITEGFHTYPADPNLLQMHALALARLGSHERASAIVEQLLSSGQSGEETLGLIAQTFKDIWLRSGRTLDLEKAFQAYLD